MLPTGGRASDVSFVASNSMFHDPELSVWNVNRTRSWACARSWTAHEYDRLDEVFLAGLRLILTATYLKKHSQNLHEDIFIRRKSHNHVLK